MRLGPCVPLAVLTPRARSWACGVLTVRREEQGAGARAASSRRERRPQRLRGFEAPQVARPGPGPLEDGQLGADTGVASPGDRAAARNWVLGENPESQQLSEGSTGARTLSLGDTKEDAGASPPTAASFRKLLQPQAVRGWRGSDHRWCVMGHASRPSGFSPVSLNLILLIPRNVHS